jgi:putative hydrolase of the HAD superfamily
MQQHLLIDGDDTLWENNIYFERAIEAFIDFLDHSSLRPNEVRAVINEIELTQGYGSASFARSLQETYRQLAEREVSDEDLERIRSFAQQIRSHPMQVIDGVRETLAYLSPRHRLILLTKGEHTLIVEEKDVNTYARLVKELDLDLPNTWMIGNSPKSDINPALAVGLNAVFIPHPHTWSLEQQEIREVEEGKGRLLTLSSFAELRDYF